MNAIAWIPILPLLAAPAAEEDWTARLGHADPAVRQEAERALIERGEESIVEPLLGSDDPEVRARANVILEAIRRNRRLREVLGPEPRRVTVRADGQPLVEVLRRLREEYRIPLCLRDVPLGATVRAQIEDADALEAVLELCRLSGAAQFDPATLTVAGGTPSNPPHITNGRWGVWLTEVAARRWSGEEVVDTEQGLLTIAVTWQTQEPPASVGIFLEEVRDERGEDLTPAEPPGGRSRWANSRFDRYIGRTGVELIVQLRSAPFGSRRLTLRGEVRIVFSIRAEEVSAEVGNERRGQASVTFRNLPIEIHWWWQEPQFRVYWAVRGVSDPDQFSGLLLVEDDAGERHEGIESRRSYGTGGFQQVVESELPEGRQPVRIVVTGPADQETVVVPFQFEDVPLE